MNPFIPADRLSQIREDIKKVADLTFQDPADVALTLLESFMSDEELEICEALDQAAVGDN